MSEPQPRALREFRIPLAVDAGMFLSFIVMAVTMWNKQGETVERLVRVEAQATERSAAQNRTTEQLARIETAQLYMTQDIQEIKEAVNVERHRR